MARRHHPLLAWLRTPEALLVACAVLAVRDLRWDRWAGSWLPAPVALALGVAGTVPLLLLDRRPALAVWTVAGADWTFMLLGRLAWPLSCVFSWLVAVGAAPLLLRRRAAVAVLVVSQAVAVAAAWLVPSRVSSTPWDVTLAQVLAALLAWTVGRYLWERRAAAAAAAVSSARVRDLETAGAAARSRAGIARELHDVVAHRVSLIAVRAATARYAVDGLSPQAERAFDEIAEDARAALAELRDVLGVLRTDAPAPHAPQPGLADIPALVEQLRGTGTDIRFHRSGERPVPAPVQLCGYRIVQEALTNATRHAPGAPVQVEVRLGADELTIHVADAGAAVTPAAGGGYGLIGMQERVSMLGGSLRAGPAADGYEVRAVLPLGHRC